MKQITYHTKLELVDDKFATYSSFNDTIYLHKDLYLFDKKMYEKSLKHEINHIGKNTLENIWHDITDRSYSLGEEIKKTIFYYKHPKLMLRMMMPLWYDKEKDLLYYNTTQIFMYLLYLILMIYLIILIV